MYKDAIVIRKAPSSIFDCDKAYLAEIEKKDWDYLNGVYNVDAMIYDDENDYWEEVAYSSIESMGDFWYGI